MFSFTTTPLRQSRAAFCSPNPCSPPPSCSGGAGPGGRHAPRPAPPPAALSRERDCIWRSHHTDRKIISMFLLDTHHAPMPRGSWPLPHASCMCTNPMHNPMHADARPRVECTSSQKHPSCCRHPGIAVATHWNHASSPTHLANHPGEPDQTRSSQSRSIARAEDPHPLPLGWEEQGVCAAPHQSVRAVVTTK